MTTKIPFTVHLVMLIIVYVLSCALSLSPVRSNRAPRLRILRRQIKVLGKYHSGFDNIQHYDVSPQKVFVLVIVLGYICMVNLSQEAASSLLLYRQVL